MILCLLSWPFFQSWLCLSVSDLITWCATCIKKNIQNIEVIQYTRWLVMCFLGTYFHQLSSSHHHHHHHHHHYCHNHHYHHHCYHHHHYHYNHHRHHHTRWYIYNTIARGGKLSSHRRLDSCDYTSMEYNKSLQVMDRYTYIHKIRTVQFTSV